MDKVILHILSGSFPDGVIRASVKLLLAAGLLDVETGEFLFFLPQDAHGITEIVINASLLITYNGKGNALPILRKYYGLTGKTSDVPKRGQHISILKEIAKVGTRSSITLDQAVQENLSETRHFPQGRVLALSTDELRAACKSDIGQIFRLYELYLNQGLVCPRLKPKAKSKSVIQLGTEAQLTIELVPKTSWFTNVRSQVSRKDWDTIRTVVAEKAKNRCQVCDGVGSRHPVECHEIWEYIEIEKIQRLLDFIALCPSCHEVKHMGMANMRGRGNVATQHLAAVNRWTENEARRYVKNVFKKWMERSPF